MDRLWQEIMREGRWLLSTPMGDDAYLYRDSMVMRLGEQRRVVSSSSLNGGSRTDLKYLFNYSCSHRPEVKNQICCEMSVPNLRVYYVDLARTLGLPEGVSAGMSTAAEIGNFASATQSAHGVEVMAVVTAGIDVNGGRAGDFATFDEFERRDLIPPAGTINIMLFIDARLDSGVLTRAIVTATEAKSAVLQELMAPSMYSEGIATGSGTDTIIAVSNDGAEIELFDAGKHVILGQMIGQTVKAALRSALEKQSGMTPQRQASIEWQCKRYGITRGRLLQLYEDKYGVVLKGGIEHPDLLTLDRDQALFARVVALIHLCDQSRWGMVEEETLGAIALDWLNDLRRTEALPPHYGRSKSLSCNEVIALLEETIVELLHARVMRG